MIKEAIVKIVSKGDLTYEEAYTVMNEIMSGQTTPTQNAAFLAALSTKSARAETTDEIAGCAAAMRAHATKVETGMELFEIVGTGGDNAHSFNISTTSALVAAAGGGKSADVNTWNKARQPGRLLPVRHRRLPGGPGGKHPAEPGEVRGAAAGGGHVLLLRPEVPHLHEVRGSHPQGAGLPYRIQHPGPPYKPRHPVHAAVGGV